MTRECVAFPPTFVPALSSRLRDIGMAWRHLDASLRLSRQDITAQRWLDGRITRLLEQDGTRNRCLNLSIVHAERCLGTALDLELPVELLQTRMHDWVIDNGRIRHTGDYFLFSGDWSSLLSNQRWSVMREATALRRARLDYRSTALYERYVALIQSGTPILRNRVALDNIAMLDAYFDRYVALFRSIQTHGLLRLEHAQEKEAGLDGTSRLRRWRTSRGERDIGVALGPNNEIVVLPGGKHRLAIATVLRLPLAPVRVRMVHADWLRWLTPADEQWCNRVSAAIIATGRRARRGFTRQSRQHRLTDRHPLPNPIV